MKKFIESLFVSIIAVFSMANALAANVAKIGDIEYATINAAFSAVKAGETIELLADVECSASIVQARNFTLEGHNHTLKCSASSDKYDYFVNVNGGSTQTFKNLTIDANGKEPYAVQCIGSASKLVLDNVTIKNAKATLLTMGYGIHVNGGKVVANNLKVSDCSTAAVFLTGNSSNGTTPSFEITGDNCDLDAVGVEDGITPALSVTAKGFSVYDVSAKYSYSVIFGTREGTKNLSNVISPLSWNQAISEIQSKISGLMKVQVKSATVTLKDNVKFKDAFTSNESRLTIDGAGKTVTGKFIFVASTPTAVKNIVLGNGSVLDCTASTKTGFSGVSVAANTSIDILLPASTDMNSYALPVSLATDAVANIFVGDKKYIAKNGVISPAEKLAQIGDKQYATLQEAIDAANGATVQVLKDVALTASLNVPAGKTLTLNLAGRKVTVSGADYALVNNGNLTIVDMGLVTVVAAEATIGDETAAPILIMAPSANDGVAVIDDATGGLIAGVQNNGTFALESGAVVAASASVPAIDNAANAVATITGGTVEGKLQAADKTALTITGGTFTGESNVSEFVGGDFGVDSNGTIVKNVAKIGEVGYLTLEDAIAAARSGDTIEILADVALDSSLYIPAEMTLTIDGNGHKLTPAAGFASNDHRAVLVLANGDKGYSSASKYTIKNLAFAGFSNLSRVIRANFCDAAIENCTFADNAVVGGVITSAEAELTVTGCEFDGNTVSGDAGYGVIDIGSDVGAGTTVIANITGNVFTDNTVEYAVVFLFSSANVTRNYFNGNIHAGSNPNAAAILAGPYTGNMSYEINITDNAFDNAISNGETDIPSVFAEDWESLGATTSFDLSANYWGGEEPVKGKDYQTNIDTAKPALDSYYTAFSIDENGAVVLDAANKVAIVPAVAQIGDTGYPTLLAAFAAAKSGDTVNLLGDLTLQAGDIDYYQNIKIPAGVTFDGGNYELVVMESQDGDYAVIWSDGAYTVQNLSIKVMGRREANRSVFNFSKGGKISNVKIWAQVLDIGVIYDKPVDGMSLIIENCEISNVTYAFYCDPNDSDIDVTIKNNVINSQRFGSMQHDEKIEGNTLTAACTKGISLGASFTGTVTGNTFAGARALSVYGNQTISGNVFSANSIVELNNGAVADLSGNYWGGEAPAENQIVADGATSVVSFTVDSYYTTYEDGVLGDLVMKQGLAGSGTEADPYVVSTAEELFLFAEKVNDGSFKNVYAVLGANIDLNQDDWTPIGTAANPFKGVFDGKGYKISNVWCTPDGDAGLFGQVGTQIEGTDGVVKNLTVEHATIIAYGEGCAGVIARAPTGAVVENVKLSGEILVQGYRGVGGIVGEGFPRIDNCVVEAEGKIYASYWGVGGILGFANDEGAKVVNAVVKGVGEGLVISSYLGGVGGVTGTPYGAATEGATVSNVELSSENNYYMAYVDASGTTAGNITVEDVVVKVNGSEIVGNDAVATVDGAPCFDLSKAFTAGGSIVLYADVDLGATLKVAAGKTVTLDLNGKTIDGTGKVRIAIMSYGDLTIKDSSAARNGAVKAGIGTGGNCINICAGTFVFDSGNIYSLNNAILIDEEEAVVNINGGTIVAEPNTENSAAFYISSQKDTVLNIADGDMTGCNGILLWNNTEINITGGKITATGRIGIQGNGSRDNTKITIGGDAEIYGCKAAIYHPQGGELVVADNAIVSGLTGIVVKGGNVTISGGFISGTGAVGDYVPVSSGFEGTGDALYVEHFDSSSSSENYGTPVVTVTGGTFFSANGKSVASYANPNSTVEALDAFISGGTFSSDVSGLCADGYVVEENSDGTFGVILDPAYGQVAQIGDSYFATLAEAIAAVQNGDTVVLLADATGDVTVAEGCEVIIDLNGNDIVGTLNAIVNNGTLTINDTVGTGNVYTTDVSAQGRAAIVNRGTIVINGGWFGDANNDTSDRNAINRGNALKNYGTAIVNGGYFTNVSNQYIGSDAYAYAINTLAGGTTVINEATVYGDINGLIYSDGKTTVNGGSFTLGRPGEENNLWYLAYGDVVIKGGTWVRAFKVPSWNTSDPKFNGNVVVSGGDYNIEIPETYRAEGYQSVKQPGKDLWQVGKLPNAEVINVGPYTVDVGAESYYIYNITNKTFTSGHKDEFDLQVTLGFIANDTVEEAAANAYGQYLTDFRIKIEGIENGSFVADEDCYLAGYYPFFGGWVKVNLDGMTIENNVGYPVITGVTEMAFTYETICDIVQSFICGIHLSDEVLQANPDLKVSLELGLAETQEKMLDGTGFITVGDTYDYTRDELQGAVALTGADYYTTVDAAVAAALESGDFVKLVNDATLQDNLELAGALDINLSGNTLYANAKTLTITDSVVTITNGTLSAFTKDNVTLSGNAVLTVTDKNVADSFRQSDTHYVSQNMDGTYSIMLKSAFRVLITMVDGEPRIGFFQDFAQGAAACTLLGATSLENADWTNVAYTQADDASGASALPLYWVKLNQDAEDTKVYRFFKIGMMQDMTE